MVSFLGCSLYISRVCFCLYADQERNSRISFKLFGKHPGQFPQTLRTQVCKFSKSPYDIPTLPITLFMSEGVARRLGRTDAHLSAAVQEPLFVCYFFHEIQKTRCILEGGGYDLIHSLVSV